MRNSSSPRAPDCPSLFASSATKFLIASNISNSGPSRQQWGFSPRGAIDPAPAGSPDGRNLIDTLGLALGLIEHLQVGRDVRIVRCFGTCGEQGGASTAILAAQHV